MISWKHSFKRLNEEYEIAKKKKQALDNLYISGKISQATRDSFDSDITAAISEIERQQKDLLSKMQAKTDELAGQIKTLEMLLANYEIQHVVGEIEEDTYQREITLLSNGLSAAKNELDIIKQATSQLCSPTPVIEAPIAPAVPEPAPAPVVEAAPAPAPIIEEAAPVIEEAAPVIETPAPIETAVVEAAPAPIEEAPAEVAPAIETTVEAAPVIEEPAPVERAPA